MTLDQQLKMMEKIDRIQAFLEKTFGGPVHIEIGWNEEPWEVLHERAVSRRIAKLTRDAIEGKKVELSTSKKKGKARDTRQASFLTDAGKLVGD